MRIRTVLCPVDFTPLSEHELQLAVDVCRRFGARLVVEHNAGGAPPSFMSVEWMWLEGHEGIDAEAMESAGRQLQAILSRLPGEVSPVGKLSRGPVDTALLFAAADVEADLIVMGSHGWGGVDHHSVTEVLIARAECPVLTVTDRTVDTDIFKAAGRGATPARVPDRSSAGRFTRSGAAAPLPGAGAIPPPGGGRRRALVPVGLTRWSLRTVEMAVALGRDLGLDLKLLHIPAASRSERLKAAATEWESRKKQALETRIRAMFPAPAPEITFLSAHGRPKEAILRVAEEGRFDLVVMGCHGGGFLRNLFTHPTSCEVLHGSPCPVWFVPRAMKGARVEELVAA